MAAIGFTISAPTTTRCEIVDDFSQFEQLTSDWNHLWSASPRSEVFQRFDWLRAWWYAYGSRIRLFSPVVYEDDRPIGILPLGLTGTTLGFLGIPGSDYTDVICPESRTPEVLNAAFSELLRNRRWSRCELRWVPEHSRLAHHIDSIDPAVRCNLQAIVTGVAGTMILGDDRDKIITQLLRKPYLKRHEHKLAKAGRLVFSHIEDKESALLHLDGMFQQHIRRRAMNGQPSQFSEPETRNFYRMMVRELDLTAELRFSVLELGGHPIAYHLGFEANGKFVMYKPTFDIDYWEYSPGDVLLYKLLDYARARGITEYDFTIGSEHYKRHFVNLTRKVYTIALDRPSLTQRLTRTAREICLCSPDYMQQSAIVGRLVSARPKLARLCSELGLRARKLTRPPSHGLSSPSRTALWRLEASTRPQGPGDVYSRQTISKLVDLALQCPGGIDCTMLQRSRERLRAGDQCLGVESNGKTFIAWLGKREELPLDGVSLRFSEPAFVLYDFWEVPRSKSKPKLHFALLCACIEQARASGLPLYVCAWKKGELSKVLRGAEFQLCTEAELDLMRSASVAQVQQADATIAITPQE